MRDCDPDNAGSPQDQTKYIPTAANTDILSVSVAAGISVFFWRLTTLPQLPELPGPGLPEPEHPEVQQGTEDGSLLWSALSGQ